MQRTLELRLSTTLGQESDVELVLFQLPQNHLQYYAAGGGSEV